MDIAEDFYLVLEFHQEHCVTEGEVLLAEFSEEELDREEDEDKWPDL